jgi:hypothetical protein
MLIGFVNDRVRAANTGQRSRLCLAHDDFIVWASSAYWHIRRQQEAS